MGFETNLVLKATGNVAVRTCALALPIALCLSASLPPAQGASGDEALATAAPRIEALVEPQAEAGLFSGVILVARGDQILFRRGYGYASWELRVPNSPSTRFGIASITKPMTGALVELLAKEGRIELTSAVEKYLPGFPKGPNGGAPTVENLLFHRAGVPHRVTSALDETGALVPSDIVRRVEAAGLLFEPGSRRLYSSAGYTCLARIVEIVEGKPYEQVLRERIFEPAKMTSATSETGHSLMVNRALPHRLGAMGRKIVVKTAPYKDLRFLTGAGSVFAAADDLLRFARAVQSGEFGGEAPQEDDSAKRTWTSWSGRTNGYESWVDILPAEDLTLVLLSNLQSAANWQAREQIKNILDGKPAVPIPLPPAVAARFEDPASLVGTYGAAAITFVDGELFRGDNEFYPIDQERYYIPASGSIMRFRRTAGGAVDAIVAIGSEGQERILAKSGAQ